MTGGGGKGRTGGGGGKERFCFCILLDRGLPLTFKSSMLDPLTPRVD